MAEEIINISGIKGKQNQDVAVATGGVRMADLEKYFDNKQKELHSLIASVASPTATYFSNVISAIQTADKQSREWNEMIVESILGLETISNNIAQTLSTSANNMSVQFASLDSWLSLMTEQMIESDKKASENSYYNQFTKSAFEILHKMIQMPYNATYLKTLKLEEIFTKGQATATATKTSTTNVDIKGDFDIKSLSDFVSNSTFYNPLMAKMFRAGFMSVANSINDGLKIIGGSVSNVEPANVLAAGELLVKIGSLVSTQQDLDKQLSLFSKDVINFSSKKSIWTKANANQFSKSFSIISEAITKGLSNIANIEVKKAALKMNDIIKFFEALQELLQGEIRTAAGTSFSIGSLIKFSGAGKSEFVDAFSPSTVRKFDTSLKMISEMMTRFFGDISKIRLPKKDKIETILSTMCSASESLGEIKDVSKKRISNLNASLIYLAVGFKSFTDELKGIEMPKDNKIMTIMTVISVVSKALERMKTIPNPQKVISRFVVGITAVYTAIGNIDIDPKSISNLEIIKGSVEYLSYISNKITDIKNPKIKIDSFTKGLDYIITWLRDVPIGKSYVSKATSINDVVDIFIIVSHKIDNIKDPKPAKKAIKVLSDIIYTIAKLEKPANKAQKVVLVIASTINTAQKTFDKIGPRTGKNLKSFAGGVMLMGIAILMLSVLAKPAKAANKTLHIISNSVAHASKELGDKKVTQASRNLKMLAVGMATIGLAALAFVALSPAIMLAMLGLKMFKFGITDFGSRKTRRAIKMGTLGIASFALAIWAFGEIVNVESMLKTAGALALLAGAMYLFNGGTGTGILGKWGGIKGGRKDDPTKQMMKTAAALALLALSVYAWQELPLGWDGVAKMAGGLVILAGACWAYSKMPPKADNNMIKIAAALGLMAGAVWVWQHTLDVSRWKELLVMGAVVAGIGFATWAYAKTPEKAGKTMIAIAAGVAALGGAAWVWQRAGITWNTAILMGVTMAGVGYAARLYEKVEKKSGVNMLILAAGVAALGGAVWVWSLAQPTWELIGMMGACVGGLAIASFAFNAVSPLAGANMLLTAAGVAALGGAVWLWNKAKPTWEVIGMMAAVVGGGAVMAALYSLPPVLIGAAGMVAVGASMLMMTGSLAAIKTLGLSLPDAENFTGILWEIATGYAKVAIPAVIGLVGATAMLPISVMTAVIGGSLSLLSVLPMPSVEHVGLFNSAVWELTIGFAKIAIPAIPAAVGAVLFLPVALGTLAAGGTLALISKLQAPDTNRITKFMQSTAAIVSGWEEISLWQLTKSVAKAAEFMIVGPATFTAALVLRMIAALNINKERVTANTESLFSFIDTVSTKFNEIGSGKKGEQIKKGTEAVGGVAKVVYDLSKAVMAVAALQYEEYEVKNGKMVLKSMNKLTEKDFELVGVGIAKLLNSITDPLVKIGEANGEDIQIGSQRVPGQNKIQKGIEALSGISNVFTPLAALVKSIAETGILKEKDSDAIIGRLEDVVTKLTTAIGNSATTIITSVSQIKIADPEGLKQVFESVGSIYNPVSGTLQAIKESGLLEIKQPEKIETFKTVFSTILDTLGNNASKVVSFVKSKGAFWNSSDTNAEGIVQVLGSIEKIYAPLSTLLKSISSTGILSAETDTAANRLKMIIPVITNSLSTTVQKILKMVEDNEDINYDAATKVMANMNNLIKPVSVLIATISATGILDDKNVDGVGKLQTVMKTVVDSVVYMIEKIGGQQKGISDATNSMSVFFKTISSANPDGLVSIRTEIDAIHAKILNETPWLKFGKNLKTFEKISANIQKNINKVNLQKLVLLEKFAKDLKDANMNGNMQALIEEIRNLINAIEDQNEAYENNFTNNMFGGDTSINNVTGDQLTDPDSTFTGGLGNALAPAAPAPAANSAQDQISNIVRAINQLASIIQKGHI